MFIDNNAIAPMPSEQRRQYTHNGVEYKPNYVTVIDGEWYTPRAIAARKKQGLVAFATLATPYI